jgi:hypothetical protein
MWGD